jgi:CRISPR-associated protein Cas2
MKGWGDHLQLSVFRCDLGPRELVELRTELASIIDHSVDQVLFVDVGPADGRATTCFDTLGRPTPPALRTVSWYSSPSSDPVPLTPRQPLASARTLIIQAVGRSSPLDRPTQPSCNADPLATQPPSPWILRERARAPSAGESRRPH